VDVFVVQELPIAPSDRQIGSDDFASQRVPAIVKIGGGGTFDSWERDRCAKEAGTLHPNPDHAEANPVAGSSWSRMHSDPLRAQENTSRR
jgi:hypothetical protein